MSRNTSEKPAAEATAQPLPQKQTQYGFALSACSTPVQHGSYSCGQSQQLTYLPASICQPVVLVKQTPPPKNYLIWSIISLIFFFLPLGIAALVFSVGVNMDYAAGLHAEAHRKSRIARVLNIVATSIHVAGLLAGAGVIIVFFGFIARL